MRKNSRFMLKVLLALTLVGAFFIAVVTLGNNNKVYASEGTEIVDTLGEEETTTTQEEVATTTQEEDESVTLTEEE